MNEEFLSREVKSSEKLILQEKYKTAQKKARFINEIKGELGEEIRQNPSGFRVIKKTFWDKVKMFFAKIFTKF